PRVMNPSQLQAILDEYGSQGLYSHAAVALARIEGPGEPLVAFYGGTTDETVFDLASLTKVLVTAPVLAALFENGSLIDKSPLKALVRLGLGQRIDELPVLSLLSHGAGLPAW